MSVDVTTVIVAVIGSGVLNTALTFLLSKVDNKDSMKTAMRLVMKDRIKYLCIQFIKQGWIYEDELDDLIVMHDSYHDDLNGNGFLDELMTKVKQLEIKVRG